MKNLVSILLVVLGIGFFALMFFFATTAYANSCFSGPAFRDEFNEDALDTTKWSNDYPSGNGGEQQYYAPDQFRINEGILSIYADRKPSHGYPYSSGIITTQRTFAQEYGYFVIRAKLPKGQSFWPAFWMLPVSRNYPIEIDVFELLGHDPKTIHMTNHWRDQEGTRRKNKLAYTGETDFSTGFHTFAVDWTPTYIKWYIDGALRYEVNQGIPAEPLFLLVNLAVGGNWPGNPDDTTPFPGVMQIDYVRVYKLGCYPSDIVRTNPKNRDACC